LSFAESGVVIGMGRIGGIRVRVVGSGTLHGVTDVVTVRGREGKRSNDEEDKSPKEFHIE